MSKIEIYDDEKIATGFWIVDFGNVDMYFEPEIPIEDIDISPLKREAIKDAALRAIDLMFKRIELTKKENNRR